ncbi:HsdR family type I site-specific deoxyribonuclease [Candidatus Poribacteria bacterium]|nr:HsdR family type I site-specific deoxyribonuclease [Candidatus Poribacteria bacterium]MYK93086.1 HsdR family type I site-specific deoxyribonuclease [Candidatus Poribacteria bacterium]
MNTVGEREIRTQERVIAFFTDALGYTYLGNWQDNSKENSNILREELADWLRRQGYDNDIIAKTLDQLQKSAAVGGTRGLYEANRDVYERLRYSVNVQPDVGEHRVPVKLIDWENPLNNDFGIAEEVTLEGEHTKRPDLVLYINGIAIGVLELKRTIVSVSEGIRQNLNNQKAEFIGWFFTTVQLVMAGSESQGLRYGVIETPEKHWLRWKETEADPAAGYNLLLRELSQLCNKERLLEILHDFIVFDAGTKKICRHNQFFGVKAAQENIKRREGGIIWHTQGSGKSLTMVWLAKWIRENIPDARVLIITDRIELDEQIKAVFSRTDDNVYHTSSRDDLLRVLRDSSERLICSLIHKFGSSEETDDSHIEEYADELQRNLPTDFRANGEFFVFVDECHRTQSGKLHRAMKKLLPDAVLIGFTGTPLLKNDKQRSIEIFGPYIHTYKYDAAVQDEVVLDLRYEARNIDQDITSQERIDEFFESKTRGLTDAAKAQLKQRWGTLLNVESSRERLKKIVADIVVDMDTRDRLKSGRGNAMLVANSIHSACRLYDLFQETPLKGKCAVVTSYRPTVASIATEETGEGLTDRQQEYNTYRSMLAAHFDEPEDTAMHKGDQFEQEVKKLFIESPDKMKLLIVVDKLLTGFDAPPATYLYIDQKRQDHGLFQAICRVNRLDTEDKEYGYIVDYKDLFRSLKQAITDYTGEAFENYDAEDVAGLLKNRLEKGKERLDDAREKIKALCEPVVPPQDTAAYIRYFCGDVSGDVNQLKANEQKRIDLYQLTAAFVRAYANLANDMSAAGYSSAETREIKTEVTHYENVRQEIKLASGDYVDLKVYEPHMRHLLDTYIRAEESETLSTFDDIPLVQLLVENGIEAAIELLPEGIRRDETAVAATIENNIRRLIVDRSEVNPRYYEEMSRLLDELIQQQKEGAMDYREYLSGVTNLSRSMIGSEMQPYYPVSINTGALRALFDNIVEVPEEHRETVAIALDRAICEARTDDWRGHVFRERRIRNAIARVISDEFSDYDLDVDTIFLLVENQNDY